MVTGAPDVPATTPSFWYRLQGTPAPGTAWFGVRVADGPASTAVYTDTRPCGWTHAWVDLSEWAGREVQLSFSVHQSAGRPAAWAALDEVSLGQAFPDVWVRKGTGRPEVRPGEPIVFDLEVGNRGGVAAAGVTLIEELPAGLVYVDAEPAPRSLSPSAWEVGDLPVGGGPYRVVLATALEPGAAGLEPLANAARVQTASDEVEVLNNQAYAEVRVCHRLRMPLIVRPW